jgi:hypothetical protein
MSAGLRASRGFVKVRKSPTEGVGRAWTQKRISKTSRAVKGEERGPHAVQSKFCFSGELFVNLWKIVRAHSP